ncbi:hypothetical protein CK203_045806 [Vitis vinifera]|uniref:Uncharacterized protein n=1 Tax=Vitis vinifera TaxID=29760 RepID=A0A438FM77_VITVI|nr:hypothetical protein CK203_045806 [Vitis vinifera]
MGFGEDEEHVQHPLRDGGRWAGGRHTANNANTALYTTFAIFDVLGGGIYNILGPLLHPLRRLLNLRKAGSYHDVIPSAGEEGFTHIGVLEHLQYGGRHRWAHLLHSELQSERCCACERRYLHWVHVLHVLRHRPYVGDPAPQLRGLGRRQPLYQHQVLRCVDGGRRDSEAIPKLEDAANGPDGMGRHPTPPAPPQKHIWYGDGIPLTRLASGMGRG